MDCRGYKECVLPAEAGSGIFNIFWMSDQIRHDACGIFLGTVKFVTPDIGRKYYDSKQHIIKIYLFLISHTDHDPKVVEVMKLSALADVQRRFEASEPW